MQADGKNRPACAGTGLNAGIKELFEGRRDCLRDGVGEIRTHAGEIQRAFRRKHDPVQLIIHILTSFRAQCSTERGDGQDHEDKGEREMKEELKKTLFIKAMAALEAYTAAVKAKPSADETKIRHERFCAIWDIIETAGLEQEYEVWKEG